MNFPFRGFAPVPGRSGQGDDSVCSMDWLAGEAWVTPPLVSIVTFAAARETCSEEAAPDWVPL